MDPLQAVAFGFAVTLFCFLLIAFVDQGPKLFRRVAVFFLSQADAWEAHRTTRKASRDDWRDKLGLTPVPDEPVTEKHA